MAAHIHQFMCLQDNFGALLHDPSTGATASIDAPEAAPVLAALEETGWTLTDILVTHRHGDHIDGIPALRERYPKARLVAPALEAAKISNVTGPIDLRVSEGEDVRIGRLTARVIATPGHTVGHVVYHFPSEEVLFAGDTLFALGCGRVFETSMTVMWESLVKIASLPGETKVYCGHEYTEANARFAVTVDPENELLLGRAKDITAMRQRGEATLPTTIAIELATNPFLRAAEPGVQATVGLLGADPAAVFAELRERKNRA